jgi:hypothetical protein
MLQTGAWTQHSEASHRNTGPLHEATSGTNHTTQCLQTQQPEVGDGGGPDFVVSTKHESVVAEVPFSDMNQAAPGSFPQSPDQTVVLDSHMVQHAQGHMLEGFPSFPSAQSLPQPQERFEHAGVSLDEVVMYTSDVLWHELTHPCHAC